MVDYKIHRAISVLERETLAGTALRIFDQPEFLPVTTPAEAGAAHALVLSALRAAVRPKHQGPDGRFVSMASKLLWLKRPQTVPIYDKYARLGLSVLGKLAPEAVDGDLADDGDLEDYAEFLARWTRLYAKAGPYLQAIENDYPYRVRLFDKVLWLVGNGAYTLTGPADDDDD